MGDALRDAYRENGQPGPLTRATLKDGGAHVVGDKPPVFVGSGAGHAKGLVPDPGAQAGTTRFLREDGTFAVPPAGGGYSDEQAQDAVGAALTDTPTLDLTYDDANGQIKGDVRGMKESGGAHLAAGAIADGQVLKRSGSSIVGVFLAVSVVALGVDGVLSLGEALLPVGPGGRAFAGGAFTQVA